MKDYFFVLSIVFISLLVFRLYQMKNEIQKTMKDAIVSEIKSQMETLLSSMETVLTEPFKNKLNEQERRQAYLLQTLKASINDTNDFKICVKRDILHLGCFTEAFCLVSLPIDTEEIVDVNVVSCLQPFFNLKRIKQTGIQDILPDALENVFVKELHLVSSQDLDLRGIEKMPNLQTLTFENCKNIFLERFLKVSHNIKTIYAINTPCLLQYKSSLEEKGIELIDL